MKFGKRVNLHTHTFRCKHAVGAPREYCAEAVRQGLCTLGFSDHQPFPDGRFDESRMPFGDLETYAREIETARQEFPELNILTGLEADYVRALGKSFYEEEFFNKRKFDYLILGPHFNDPPEAGAGAGAAENVRLRVESTIRAMETGLFAYVAHPDMFACTGLSWTPEIEALCKELVSAAVALKVPLEINAYGLRKPWIDTAEGRRPQYPWRPFWELVAELGATMVVGADAHRPEDVWSNAEQTAAWGAQFGLVPANAAVAAAIVNGRKPR